MVNKAGGKAGKRWNIDVRLPFWIKSCIRSFIGNSRVFFADEKTALVTGYHPCGNCLRKKYREYIDDPDAYKARFGL